MLEHARKFLELVIPPAQEYGGYLNIHWANVGRSGNKNWDGRANTTVDGAIKDLKWLLSKRDKDPKDFYVCMSLQSEVEERTSQNGYQYTRAHRLAANTVAIQSLYIDVDVKDGAYSDTAEALRELKRFMDEAKMPMPSAVVGSGSGGFHVHWALDKALKREEWQVLADSLAEATRTHNLLTDSQCTVDAARILRIPGTFNYKSGVPREVTLMSLGSKVSLEQMREVLEPYKPAFVHNRVTAPRIDVNDELGAGIEAKRVEVKLEDLCKGCPFVARTIGTGGADNAQPVWFLTASMASFLEDGREAFHLMSNQHPGYKPEETDAMYDRVSANKDGKNIGWPMCERIASYGVKECVSCPNRGLGKSPMHFAISQAEPKVDDDTLPPRYLRTPDGFIMGRNINEDGTTELVSIVDYPIIDGWLSNNPWTFHFITRAENAKKVTIEVPTEVIFAKEGFGKYLGSKGFFCTDKQYKLVKEFFVAWLQKLQASKESVISTAPFGWSDVDGKTEGFTYAGRVWTKDGDRPAANPNPQLQYQYTPKGDIKAWSEAARIIYDQQRPGLNAILAVAFAAPLVKFTGFGGLILNAYSPESGIGKTTAMKVSQAVWASPVLAMQGLEDTSNFVLNKMGQLRSLPMYWDEIKSDEQVNRFCSIVFTLTGGREKGRLTADATLRASGTWQTMMVSASNDSLVDGMARKVGSTTAGLHRLFEYVVAKPTVAIQDIGVVQRLLGRLDDNYGHAGLAYAKFLGSNFQRVEHEVARMQDELYNEVNVKQEERMWIATMAVLLKGAEYANNLGLTDIDLPGLKAFLLEVLDRMRTEVEASPTDLTNDMSVSSVLAEFLNATRARNTLITNRIWVSRGKPAANAIQVRCDRSKLGEIVVHIGQEDKLMRFSSTYFSRWMGERGYSRQTWTKKMEKEFGLKMVNGKLGGGTDMVCAMEYLIELDLNHPKLAAFIE